MSGSIARAARMMSARRGAKNSRHMPGRSIIRPGMPTSSSRASTSTPGPGQGHRVPAGQRGEPVEQEVGRVGPLHEVGQEALQPAKPPRGFEELAAEVGQVAAGREPAPVQLLHLAGEPLGDVGRAEVGEGEAAEVGAGLVRSSGSPRPGALGWYPR